MPDTARDVIAREIQSFYDPHSDGYVGETAKSVADDILAALTAAGYLPGQLDGDSLEAIRAKARAYEVEAMPLEQFGYYDQSDPENQRKTQEFVRLRDKAEVLYELARQMKEAGK